jgi:hypothetical protein
VIRGEAPQGMYQGNAGAPVDIRRDEHPAVCRRNGTPVLAHDGRALLLPALRCRD